MCPHLFYQVCRVTGKNSGPCEELKINGTDVIEIPTDPLNDNTIICDCVGILKERFADVEQRFPKHKNWKTSKKKSTKCRMIFRTTIENSNGDTEVLTIVSDVINCTQLPGTPEILKMSLSSCSVRGGEELWIIGKNFLKDTKVVFSHQSPGKEEPTWTKTAEPEAEFFHQTHLITKVPPFYNQELSESVEINVFIKCGDKLSDTVPFTYNPSSGGQQAESNLNTRLPKGVAEPALAINNQFTKTGSVSVITGMGSVKINGDATGHNHKNKKSKMDPGNRNSRRTRSVPRPNLIEEDTLFATDQNFKTVTVGGGGATTGPVTMTSFSQTSFSSWKDNPPARNVQEHVFGQNFSTSNAMRMRNSLSVSVDEDSRTLTKDDQHHHDESSFHSPPRVEFSSNLTRDFSGAFDLKAANEEPPKQRLSFAGALMTQTSASQTNKTSVSETPGYLSQTPETVPSIIETQRLKCAKPSDTGHSSDSTPSVSVKKSDEGEEKATISISLPTSILKDQKHFQSVIETINNTLLTKNTEEPEEKEVPQATSNPSPSTVWLLDPPEPSSPSRKITSMPVSVLSNTRKRNISSELVSQQTPSEASYQPQSGAEAVTSGGQASAESSQQAQESKWSAEFNQVLTTMIEAQANTGQMDWAPVSQQKLAPASMDWSCGKTDSGSVTTDPVSSVSGPQGGSGYLVTSSVPVLSIPEANMGPVVTLVTPSQQGPGAGVFLTNSSQSQSAQQIVLSSAASSSIGQSELINNQQQQFEPIAAQQQQQIQVSNQQQQQLQVNSQQIQVCSPPQQFQSINSQEQQQFNVQQQTQFESLGGQQQTHFDSLQQQQQFDSIGSQQQFGQITNQTQLSSEQQQQQQPQQYEQIVNQQQQFQPNESQQQQQYETVAKQQQCIAVSSPVSVDDFIQNSSVQNSYSSYEPPSASGSVSNPASVEQQPPAANPWVEVSITTTFSQTIIHYFQDMAPIQGDPLLSEASSVIEIQKTIESAGVSSEPQPPEIPRDQQWVNTPQSSDWT